LTHVSTLKAIAKEILVGMMNGFTAGLVTGAIAWLITGNFLLGAVIVMAMTANLLAAGLVGVAVPLTMKALRADPALASTVFVTATTDIFGFFIFLSLASVLLA
jgi:magnesium transporter